MADIQLFQGDCLEVMPTLEVDSIDLVLCDPPYGTTACKWDSVIPLEPMWECLKRVTKKQAAIVMTASQPFTTALIHSNSKYFRYCWVWKKTVGGGFLNANKQPLKRHEDIVVFCASQSQYNPQKSQGSPYVTAAGNVGAALTKDKAILTGRWKTVSNGDRYPTSILEIPNQTGFHPTQKPVALMEYLIKTYTQSGDTVLDFTMGSGTTGVAAKKLGRNFIGIELNPEYFEIAKNRIDDTWAPGQNAPTVQKVKGDKEQLDIWDALSA